MIKRMQGGWLFGAPLLNQGIAEGQQGGSQEQSEETQHQQAAEHAEQQQDERQIAATADQIETHETLEGAEYHQIPHAYEDRPSNIAGVGKPEQGREPDQRRSERYQRQKKTQQSEQPGARHAGEQEAEAGEQRLHQVRSQDAVEHAANRAAGDRRQPVATDAVDASQAGMQPHGNGGAVAVKEESYHEAEQQPREAASQAGEMPAPAGIWPPMPQTLRNARREHAIHRRSLAQSPSLRTFETRARARGESTVRFLPPGTSI